MRRVSVREWPERLLRAVLVPPGPLVRRAREVSAQQPEPEQRAQRASVRQQRELKVREVSELRKSPVPGASEV